MSVSDWTPPGNASPPRELASPAPRCSLWWCELAHADDSAASLAAWLSPVEHARARRFATPDRANRYIAGRAALRWILSQVLSLAPADVPIERGERGRPRLALPDGPDFNVSNTRDVALIGISFAPGTRIGVDVEHLDRPVRHDALARKFLTAGERAAIAGLDDDSRRRAFLRYWTSKEAMSKATGEALAAPLRRLEVTFEAGPRLVAGPPPYVPYAWTLHDGRVPVDYVATVALWQRKSAAGARSARRPSTGEPPPG